MSIESLKKRVGSFIENQKKRSLETQQVKLGRGFVNRLEETLSISLTDNHDGNGHQSDLDFLGWGQLVQLIHRRYCIQTLNNPDVDVSVNALIGFVDTLRGQVSFLTDEEFNQKLASYNDGSNGELMQQLLIKLRSIPQKGSKS